MEENKKEYSVVGTVTIGSDEYRDLVTEVVYNKGEAEKYRSDWWRERDKANALEKKVEALQNELVKYKKYIKENGEQDKMELWILKVNREE